MTVLLVGAVVATAVAAVCDFRSGHIPNWLVLLLFVFGVLGNLAIRTFHGGVGAMLPALGISLGGAVFCAIVPALLYRVGAIGGGDLKLFAALGATLGPLFGMEAETYSFVAAAVLAPAKLAYEGRLFRTLGNSLQLFANVFLPKARRRVIDPESMSWFRLGPAILVGTILAILANVSPL